MSDLCASVFATSANRDLVTRAIYAAAKGFEALAYDDYVEAVERFAVVDGYTRLIAATTPCAPSCGACVVLS